MPAEHGAWGILLVPLACAAGVAGLTRATILPFTLITMCALAIFVLRGSLEAHLAEQNDWRRIASAPHLALALLAAISGGALLLVYGRWQLVSLGIAAGHLYGLQWFITRRHAAGSNVEKRSLIAELVGVLLLTSAAPAAWIAMRGAFDAVAAQLWAMNAAFFCGGVLYVKYRVRGLLAHQKFSGAGERVRFAWPVFVYHFLLAAMLASVALTGQISLAVTLAFVPGVIRAMALAGQLGRRFPIKRLGWSEVAQGVAFAALLILAFRQ